MSDTIVTNDNGTTIVHTEEHNTVITVDQAPKTIITGIMGPPGSSKISDAKDVDLAALSSGSVLVYNPNTSKWVATIDLNQQHMDGGQF